MDLRPKLVFFMVLAVFLAASGASSVSGVASASPAATFSVTPQTTLPNQTVLLLGTGFSPSATSGGAGLFGAHQVTGTGGSVVSVGDVPLAWPNVTYPINFDGDGSWTASITIPLTGEVVAGGPVSINVVDDQGVTRTTQVTIRTPNIDVDPESSRINTDVTITGKDFPASNAATGAASQVSISYAGTLIKVVSADSNGEFITTVPVPTATAIASNNTVKARIVGFDQWATAIHAVPGATITVFPTSGRAGTAVTISGEGFPANVIVSNNSAGNITVSSSPSPATDNDGNFESYFAMPVFSPGIQTITATAGGITGVSSFTVLEGTPVSQPLPTPKPSTLPVDALASLTQAENLIRVWAFDNSTKRWEFFDPRPAFVNANTIKIMVPGRIYWLRMNQAQVAGLNGKRVELFSGWNLVPW